MLQLLLSLGALGVFSLRTFLPAFVLALVARLWPQLPAPATWLTTTPALVALGALALLELAAHRFQDARELVRRVDAPIKGLVAGALLGLAPGIAAAAGALLRSRVLGSLAGIDDEDDLHLQGLLAWTEDAWVILGCAAMLLVPAAAAGLGVATVVSLLALGLVVGRVDRRTAACVACGRELNAAALSCPRCGAAAPAPRQGAALGSPVSAPVRDVAEHRRRLIAGHRCPRCASRLPDAAAPLRCTACGEEVLAPAELADYLEAIDRRLPGVLAVCGVLGLVPLAGAVAGIAYHRVLLVAPLRRYLPLRRRVLAGAATGVLYLALAAVQAVPLAGAIAGPAAALAAHRIVRWQLETGLQRQRGSRGGL